MPPKRAFDRLAFDALEIQVVDVRRFRGGSRIRFQLEIGLFERRASGKNDRPLQRMFERADVARPAVCSKRLQNAWRKLRRLLAVPARVHLRVVPGENAGGAQSNLFRAVMLGLQFAISIFMLAMVMIVFFQNERVHSSGGIYPRSQILTLDRMHVEDLRGRHETLANELTRLPGVTAVAYSSQVPYEQNNSANLVGADATDREAAFTMMSVRIDTRFLPVYDIPLLAGRNFDLAIADDSEHDDRYTQNIIVNQLAMSRLGVTNPVDAIGQVFYTFPDEGPQTTYTIVGVVPDQNFQGFHNQIKPMAYSMDPGSYRLASIRVEGRGLPDTLAAVEDVWDEIVPDYPIQARFLE